MPENIVDVRLHVFLVLRALASTCFANATAIQIPAFVSVSHLDAIALGNIFSTISKRRNGDRVVLEVSETTEFTRMSELACASAASDVMNAQVRGAAQPLDRLLQDFFSFRRALRRHHHFGLLRGGNRDNC